MCVYVYAYIFGGVCGQNPDFYSEAEAPVYEVILGASLEDDSYWSTGQAPPTVPCAPPSSQAHKSATSVPRQPPGHLQLLLNRSG